MQHYILVFIATVLLAVDFAFQKRYQQKQGTDVKAGLTFNAVIGLLTAMIFFIVNGFAIKLSLYSIVMAACMSICLLSYTILGFKVLKEGNMAFYTMFLMTGGMVVPYVWGVLFLDEPLSMLRLVGLIIIVVAIVLSNCSVAKSTPKTVVLCVVIFFLNGGCSVISKLCQMPGAYGAVEPTEFVMWTGVTRFLLCSAVLFIFKFRPQSERGEGADFKAVLPIIVGSERSFIHASANWGSESPGDGALSHGIRWTHYLFHIGGSNLF